VSQHARHDPSLRTATSFSSTSSSLKTRTDTCVQRTDVNTYMQLLHAYGETQHMCLYVRTYLQNTCVYTHIKSYASTSTRVHVRTSIHTYINSLVWYVPSLRHTRGLGWRMHCGAEVTESSTNKQHHHALAGSSAQHTHMRKLKPRV
jgi:hypothetical protein